jgi:hypothetical protein
MGEVIQLLPAKEHRSEFVIIGGLEGAIVGFGERAGLSEKFAIYDLDICVEIVMDSMCVAEEEAREMMEEVIAGSWNSTSTPVFITQGAIV